MKIRPLFFAAICGLSFLSVSCSGETSSFFGGDDNDNRDDRDRIIRDDGQTLG